MPTRRKAKGFRPLSQRGAAQTDNVRAERALREREALEVARAAAQFDMDRLRREQRQGQEGDDPALAHFLPAGHDEPDLGEWEEDKAGHRPERPADDILDPDPILAGMEGQAKLIRRLRKIENWENIYEQVFNEFLVGQERTKHWSDSLWHHDYQGDCDCGSAGRTSTIRHREVVLVGLHSKPFFLSLQ